ncbi:MAG: NUDIX hydrolase [Spirochaetota bacterium]
MTTSDSQTGSSVSASAAADTAFLRERSRFEGQLARYAERHPEEADNVARFERLLEAGRDAFFREHAGGHFTASALVFDPARTSIVLTHHRKLDIWIQLGGHADGQADLATAALREAEEESGLSGLELASAGIVDIDIHPIPAHGSEPPHDHYDVRFAFIAAGGRDLVVSDESHDLAWVAVDRVAEYSDERSLHRAIARALARLDG